MISIVKEFEFPLSDLMEKAQKEIQNLNGEIQEEDDLKFQFQELHKELSHVCNRLREVEKYQQRLQNHEQAV